MMMRTSQSCSAVLVASLTCCLLLAWCKTGVGQDVEVASVALPFVATDFPQTRLPTPAAGWTFANTYQRVSATVKAGGSTGVLELVVRHLPIPGVTVDAVYWMYRNLHKAVKYTPAGSTTARTVPMFQLLHPVDHLSFSCSDPHVKNGSSLDWIELQMTKCRIMAGPGGLWNCSDAVTNRDRRKGFVRTDPAVQWTKKFLPTKLTSTVTQLDKSGYKGYVMAQGFPVSYVAHSWADATTSQGAALNVTTTIRVGLLKAGTGGEYVYDTSNFLYSTANGMIKTALLDNTDVTTVRRIGNGMMLHSIQEWQNLRTWLQSVWTANKGTLPAEE